MVCYEHAKAVHFTREPRSGPESVSKAMLGEIQAQETVLKLKRPEDVTLHAVGTEAYTGTLST